MIISSSADYRAAAQQFLPPFLFHYIAGGAYAEQTLRRNVDDFAAVALRQRVLKDMSQLDTSIELFGEKLSIPVALSPVGLTGMYAAAARCRPRARLTNTAFRSPCPPCRSAPLKKWRPKSSAPCGSSSMC